MFIGLTFRALGSRMATGACLSVLVLLVLPGCASFATQWGDRPGWGRPATQWRPVSPLPPQLSGDFTVSELTGELVGVTGMPAVVDSHVVTLRFVPLQWADLLSALRSAGWVPGAGVWRHLDVGVGGTMLPRRMAVVEWRLVQSSVGSDFGDLTGAVSLAQGAVVVPDGGTAVESNQSTRILSSPVFASGVGQAIATTQSSATAGLSASVSVEFLDGAFRVAGVVNDSSFTGTDGGSSGGAVIPIDVDVPAGRWVPVGSIIEGGLGGTFVPWSVAGSVSGSVGTVWVRVSAL